MNELKEFKRSLSSIDRDYYLKVKNNFDHIAKPLDSLGYFEDIFARIGSILKTDNLILNKLLTIMIADNGIVEEGISQSDHTVTTSVAIEMANGKSSVCKMAKHLNCDVLPIDIGMIDNVSVNGLSVHKVRNGTRNFMHQPALTEIEILDAIDIGIHVVKDAKDKGKTIIATGEMGIGNTTTSTGIISTLLNIPVQEIVGRGAGLSDEGLKKKIFVIEEAQNKYKLSSSNPLKVLCVFGGLDIAGLVGIFIGGGIYGIPIVIDGTISAASAVMAESLVEGTKDFMLPSHSRRLNGSIGRSLDFLGLKPIILGNLSLGEGTGAMMLLSLLDMINTIYSNPTSFNDISVEQYERFI